MSIDNGEEVRVVSATGGEKGSKDAQLGAVDPLALLELAKVAGFGAKKYDNFNYLRGYDWLLSINAGERHGLQFAAGEDLDPESGLCHAAHAAWNYLALTSFYLRKIGNDNRVSAFLAGQEEIDLDHDEYVGLFTDDPPKYWTDPHSGATIGVDWSNPAPDFWYWEVEDDIFDETNDIAEYALVDDSYVEGTAVDEDDESCLGAVYQILNPEVFGEFKPVELPESMYRDRDLEVEESPFKVGDKVDVWKDISEKWESNGVVSNIDYDADALRVKYDDGEVEWVQTDYVRKVS